MRTLKLTFITLALLAMTGWTDLSAPPAGAAGRENLTTLRALVTRDNFREMGFNSASEPGAATLMEPIAVYMVRLDQLRQTGAGEDVEALLEDLATAVYLVRVGDEVRSSIVMSRQQGEWKATAFGAALRAQRIDRVRRSTAKATGLPLSEFFLVEVPGLHASFLGHDGQDGLRLTPLSDDPTLQLHAGQTAPAATLLPQLGRLARERGLE